MEAKPSTFIISMILISIVVLGFGVFYSGITTNYGATNNQNITRYNQLASINNITENLADEMNEPASSSSGGFNIIGDYLAKGYKTFKLMFTSYDYFSAMLTYAIEGTPWGDGGTGNTVSIIFTALGMIVLIIIIVSGIEILSGRNGL